MVVLNGGCSCRVFRLLNIVGLGIVELDEGRYIWASVNGGGDFYWESSDSLMKAARG